MTHTFNFIQDSNRLDRFSTSFLDSNLICN